MLRWELVNGCLLDGFLSYFDATFNLLTSLCLSVYLTFAELYLYLLHTLPLHLISFLTELLSKPPLTLQDTDQNALIDFLGFEALEQGLEMDLEFGF